MQPSSQVQPPSPSSDVGKRFSAGTVVALVLLVLSLILIGVTTSLSWWNISSTNGSSASFYLTNACASGSCQGYQGEPGVQDVFALTNDLVLIGFALGILALVLFIVSIFYPRLRVGTLAAGGIGSTLLLVGAVYLYLALPGAISTLTGTSQVTTFFGSYTYPGGFFTSPYTTTWGGGSGWYLAFVAWGVLLISTFIAFSSLGRLASLGGFRLPPAGTPPPVSPYEGQVPLTQPVALPPSQVFCPACGSHYPAGTRYCSRDATALKEVPR